MKNETKLKIAIEEIKEILKKHDITGAITLHAPDRGEFLLHLSSSYSCAYIYNDNEIRFRSKIEDYPEEENPEEKRNKKLQDTVNMMHILSQVTGNNALNLMKISKDLDKKLGAEHFR